MARIKVMQLLFRIVIISFVVFSALAFDTQAAGQSQYAPFKISGIYLTDAEYFSLPDFLQVKVRYHIGGSPEHSAMNAKFGIDYQHYHHWAAAIIKFNRAMQPEAFKNRNINLKQILGEYDYLLRHCTPKNQFRYLFHLRKGEIYYILNEYSLAANELQQSLNYKVDNGQTYSVLSNVYSRLGMVTQARDALKKAQELNAIK